MNKKIFAILTMIVLVVFLCACGMVDQVRAWKNGGTDSGELAPGEDIAIEDQLADSDTQTADETGNADLASDENAAAGDEADGNDAAPQQGGGKTCDVVLYFVSDDGQALEAEIRSIVSQQGLARATINELIAGPVSTDLSPTLPASTILEDINITDSGLCIVDFSSELIEDHPGGSLAEQMTIYSIVNTLTQFPSVDKVQILVGGQIVDTIAGHSQITSAMSRNEDLIL